MHICARIKWLSPSLPGSCGRLFWPHPSQQPPCELCCPWWTRILFKSLFTFPVVLQVKPQFVSTFNSWFKGGSWECEWRGTDNCIVQRTNSPWTMLSGSPQTQTQRCVRPASLRQTSSGIQRNAFSRAHKDFGAPLSAAGDVIRGQMLPDTTLLSDKVVKYLTSKLAEWQTRTRNALSSHAENISPSVDFLLERQTEVQ